MTNHKINRISRAKWLHYGSAVLGIHILGLSLLLFNAGNYPQLLGLGFLAYTLGLRHAFDADHIAAIDNTVRKLVQEKLDPTGVGFYFSLGHSSVVLIMSIVTVVSMNWAQQNIPQLKELGGLIGAAVSGSFLLLIGILNLYVWADLYRLFRQMRKGDYDDNNLEQVLLDRGLISRFCGPLYCFIKKSWHVYPLGFLFGLGFDTASEVALLAISANAAAQPTPVGAVLALPVLFAAGMSLMDTIDGVFMTTAYSWAFSTSLRKIYYNLTVTGLSVVAALLIGIVELGQILISKLGLNSGQWQWVMDLNFGNMGYVLVVLFIMTWGISYLFWKFLQPENAQQSAQKSSSINRMGSMGGMGR